MKTRGVVERLLEDFASRRAGDSITDAEFKTRVLLVTSHPVDVAGLRLAFDCMRRDEKAIRELKNRLESASALLGRDLVSDRDLRAELCQKTYVRLLYGGSRQQRGYLLTYAGRARIEVWLRTVLLRQGLAQKRRQEKEIPLETIVEDLAVGPDSVTPELEFLKRRYAHEFKLAFRQSLASLSARDRLVLRYHLMDKLTAEEIGHRFDVHRVTVARWMRRIRQALLEQTVAHWNTALPKRTDELEVVFGLIESQVNASFAGLHSGLACSS